MGIQDRKLKDQANLRQKILDAALLVFAGQGYGKVSMRRIAALIDYSPTTIYRFFRNKEELLQTIIADTYKDLSARFDTIKAKAGEDPLAALKALIREYVVFCVERPEMTRLFLDLASFEMEDGIMYERLGGTRHRVYQSWSEFIRKSIDSGRLEVGDEPRIFLFLWDTANGYLNQRISYPRVPRKPLAQDLDEYLGLVFRGIENR
jgi:AcrR family transcriptional regulator